MITHTYKYIYIWTANTGYTTKLISILKTNLPWSKIKLFVQPKLRWPRITKFDLARFGGKGKVFKAIFRRQLRSQNILNSPGIKRWKDWVWQFSCAHLGLAQHRYLSTYYLLLLSQLNFEHFPSFVLSKSFSEFESTQRA